MKKNFIQLLASMLSLTFIFPYLSWAFEPGMYAQAISQTSGVSYRGKAIAFPSKLGQIEKMRSGQKKLVIHIQDLHCNYEVQKNIAGMIHWLAQEHGLKLVGAEGAFYPVDLNVIRQFPIPKIREAVSDYFVRQGRLTGAEYYAATGQHAIRLEGIETPRLYEESLAAVRTFLNAESQGYCLDLREALEELKADFYTPTLLAIDQDLTGYQQGQSDALSYARRLQQHAQENRISLDGYPELKKYLHLGDPRLGGEVEPGQLFREMESLDQAVRECVYTTQAQRELDGQVRRLLTIEKLLNISVTPEELALFQEARAAYSVQALMDYLRRAQPAGREVDRDIDPGVYALDRDLDRVEAFYRLADVRSRHFAQNILRSMETQHENLAVVITGGFHSDLLMHELEKQGIGYVSVKPRLTRHDVANPYFSLLQGRILPIEKLLAKNQTILAPRLWAEAGEGFAPTLGITLGVPGCACRADLATSVQRQIQAWFAQQQIGIAEPIRLTPEQVKRKTGTGLPDDCQVYAVRTSQGAELLAVVTQKGAKVTLPGQTQIDMDYNHSQLTVVGDEASLGRALASRKASQRFFSWPAINQAMHRMVRESARRIVGLAASVRVILKNFAAGNVVMHGNAYQRVASAYAKPILTFVLLTATASGLAISQAPVEARYLGLLAAMTVATMTLYDAYGKTDLAIDFLVFNAARREIVQGNRKTKQTVILQMGSRGSSGRKKTEKHNKGQSEKKYKPRATASADKNVETTILPRSGFPLKKISRLLMVGLTLAMVVVGGLFYLKSDRFPGLKQAVTSTWHRFQPTRGDEVEREKWKKFFSGVYEQFLQNSMNLKTDSQLRQQLLEEAKRLDPQLANLLVRLMDMQAKKAAGHFVDATQLSREFNRILTPWHLFAQSLSPADTYPGMGFFIHEIESIRKITLTEIGTKMQYTNSVRLLKRLSKIVYFFDAAGEYYPDEGWINVYLDANDPGAARILEMAFDPEMRFSRWQFGFADAVDANAIENIHAHFLPWLTEEDGKAWQDLYAVFSQGNASIAQFIRQHPEIPMQLNSMPLLSVQVARLQRDIQELPPAQQRLFTDFYNQQIAPLYHAIQANAARYHSILHGISTRLDQALDSIVRQGLREDLMALSSEKERKLIETYYHGRFPTLLQQLSDGLEQIGLSFVFNLDQPYSSEDFRQLRTLQQKLSMPLAGFESIEKFYQEHQSAHVAYNRLRDELIRRLGIATAGHEFWHAYLIHLAQQAGRKFDISGHEAVVMAAELGYFGSGIQHIALYQYIFNLLSNPRTEHAWATFSHYWFLQNGRFTPLRPSQVQPVSPEKLGDWLTSFTPDQIQRGFRAYLGTPPFKEVQPNPDQITVQISEPQAPGQGASRMWFEIHYQLQSALRWLAVRFSNHGAAWQASRLSLAQTKAAGREDAWRIFQQRAHWIENTYLWLIITGALALGAWLMAGDAGFVSTLVDQVVSTDLVSWGKVLSMVGWLALFVGSHYNKGTPAENRNAAWTIFIVVVLTHFFPLWVVALLSYEAHGYVNGHGLIHSLNRIFSGSTRLSRLGQGLAGAYFVIQVGLLLVFSAYAHAELQLFPKAHRAPRAIESLVQSDDHIQWRDFFQSKDNLFNQFTFNSLNGTHDEKLNQRLLEEANKVDPLLANVLSYLMKTQAEANQNKTIDAEYLIQAFYDILEPRHLFAQYLSSSNPKQPGNCGFRIHEKKFFREIKVRDPRSGEKVNRRVWFVEPLSRAPFRMILGEKYPAVDDQVVYLNAVEIYAASMLEMALNPEMHLSKWQFGFEQDLSAEVIERVHRWFLHLLPADDAQAWKSLYAVVNQGQTELRDFYEKNPDFPLRGSNLPFTPGEVDEIQGQAARLAPRARKKFDEHWNQKILPLYQAIHQKREHYQAILEKIKARLDSPLDQVIRGMLRGDLLKIASADDIDQAEAYFAGKFVQFIDALKASGIARNIVSEKDFETTVRSNGTFNLSAIKNMHQKLSEPLPDFDALDSLYLEYIQAQQAYDRVHNRLVIELGIGVAGHEFIHDYFSSGVERIVFAAGFGYFSPHTVRIQSVDVFLTALYTQTQDTQAYGAYYRFFKNGLVTAQPNDLKPAQPEELADLLRGLTPAGLIKGFRRYIRHQDNLDQWLESRDLGEKIIEVGSLNQGASRMWFEVHYQVIYAYAGVKSWFLNRKADWKEAKAELALAKAMGREDAWRIFQQRAYWIENTYLWLIITGALAVGAWVMAGDAGFVATLVDQVVSTDLVSWGKLTSLGAWLVLFVGSHYNKGTPAENRAAAWKIFVYILLAHAAPLWVVLPVSYGIHAWVNDSNIVLWARRLGEETAHWVVARLTGAQVITKNFAAGEVVIRGNAYQRLAAAYAKPVLSAMFLAASASGWLTSTTPLAVHYVSMLAAVLLATSAAVNFHRSAEHVTDQAVFMQAWEDIRKGNSRASRQAILRLDRTDNPVDQTGGTPQDLKDIIVAARQRMQQSPQQELSVLLGESLRDLPSVLKALPAAYLEKRRLKDQTVVGTISGQKINFGYYLQGLVAQPKVPGIKKGDPDLKVLVNVENPKHSLAVIYRHGRITFFDLETHTWSKEFMAGQNTILGSEELLSDPVLADFMDQAIVDAFGKIDAQTQLLQDRTKIRSHNANNASEIAFQPITFRLPKITDKLWKALRLRRLDEKKSHFKRYVGLMGKGPGQWLFFLATPKWIRIYDQSGQLVRIPREASEARKGDIYLNTFLLEQALQQGTWQQRHLGKENKSLSEPTGAIEIGAARTKGVELVFYWRSGFFVETPNEGSISLYTWLPVVRLLDENKNRLMEGIRFDENQMVFDGIGSLRNTQEPLYVLFGNYFYMPNVVHDLPEGIIAPDLKDAIGMRGLDPAGEPISQKHYMLVRTDKVIPARVDGRWQDRTVVYIVEKGSQWQSKAQALAVNETVGGIDDTPAGHSGQGASRMWFEIHYQLQFALQWLAMRFSNRGAAWQAARLSLAQTKADGREDAWRTFQQRAHWIENTYLWLIITGALAVGAWVMAGDAGFVGTLVDQVMGSDLMSWGKLTSLGAWLALFVGSHYNFKWLQQFVGKLFNKGEPGYATPRANQHAAWMIFSLIVSAHLLPLWAAALLSYEAHAYVNQRGVIRRIAAWMNREALKKYAVIFAGVFIAVSGMGWAIPEQSMVQVHLLSGMAALTLALHTLRALDGQVKPAWIQNNFAFSKIARFPGRTMADHAPGLQMASRTSTRNRQSNKTELPRAYQEIVGSVRKVLQESNEADLPQNLNKVLEQLPAILAQLSKPYIEQNRSDKNSLVVTISSKIINFGYYLQGFVACPKPVGHKTGEEDIRVLINVKRPENSLAIIHHRDAVLFYDTQTRKMSGRFLLGKKEVLKISRLIREPIVAGFMDRVMVDHLGETDVQARLLQTSGKRNKHRTRYPSEISFAPVTFYLPSTRPKLWADLDITRVDEKKTRSQRWVGLLDNQTTNRLFFLATPQNVHIYDQYGKITDIPRKPEGVQNADIFLKTFLVENISRGEWVSRGLGDATTTQQQPACMVEIGSAEVNGVILDFYYRKAFVLQTPNQGAINIDEGVWTPVARVLDQNLNRITQIIRFAPNQCVVEGIGSLRKTDSPLVVLFGNYFYIPNVVHDLPQAIIDPSFKDAVEARGTYATGEVVSKRRYRLVATNLHLPARVDGRWHKRKVVFVVEKGSAWETCANNMARASQQSAKPHAKVRVDRKEVVIEINSNRYVFEYRPVKDSRQVGFALNYYGAGGNWDDWSGMPDVFIYSRKDENFGNRQGLRGIQIKEHNGLRNKGLMRPVVALFFYLFPNVRVTYGNIRLPNLIHLLIREFGFGPETDLSPNAWITNTDKKSAGDKAVSIYFENRKDREHFLLEGPLKERNLFNVLSEKPSGGVPIYYRQPLVIKDKFKFESAMKSVAIEVVEPYQSAGMSLGASRMWFEVHYQVIYAYAGVKSWFLNRKADWKQAKAELALAKAMGREDAWRTFRQRAHWIENTYLWLIITGALAVGAWVMAGDAGFVATLVDQVVSTDLMSWGKLISLGAWLALFVGSHDNKGTPAANQVAAWKIFGYILLAHAAPLWVVLPLSYVIHDWVNHPTRLTVTKLQLSLEPDAASRPAFSTSFSADLLRRLNQRMRMDYFSRDPVFTASVALRNLGAAVVSPHYLLIEDTESGLVRFFIQLFQGRYISRFDPAITLPGLLIRWHDHPTGRLGGVKQKLARALIPLIIRVTGWQHVAPGWRVGLRQLAGTLGLGSVGGLVASVANADRFNKAIAKMQEQEWVTAGQEPSAHLARRYEILLRPFQQEWLETAAEGQLAARLTGLQGMRVMGWKTIAVTHAGQTYRLPLPLDRGARLIVLRQLRRVPVIQMHEPKVRPLRRAVKFGSSA